MLHVSSNRIESLRGLDAFGHLTYLSMRKNLVRAVDSIDAMMFVRYLDISDNRLLSLEGMAALPNLETLIVAKNMIRSISGLEALERLSLLDLRFNCIQNLDGLPDKLSRTIGSLYLDSNPIVEPVNLLFLRPFTNVDSLSLVDTPMGKKLGKKGYMLLTQS
jgi:Leucine-rich repeat (LRR) protein